MPVRGAAETIDLLIKSMASKDYESANALFAPDVVVVEPDSVPFYSGTHRGWEAVQRDLFGPMLTNYDLTVNPGTKAHDAGDVVVGTLDLTVTSRATGASVRTNVVEIYTVVDGLIRHIDVYYKDPVLMARAFPEGLPTSDAHTTTQSVG